MRTARSSSRPGGSPPGSLTGADTPPQSRQPPLEQTPPRADRHPPPPWTEFLTHAYENITLPQTSLTGGKNPIFAVPRMLVNNSIPYRAIAGRIEPFNQSKCLLDIYCLFFLLTW